MPDLRDYLQESMGAAYGLGPEITGAGMSRVFLAEDKTLHRRVVFKVLAPEAGADLSLERFKREIVFAAQLQHPHIVPLLAAGDLNGLPYYTMPFVEGQSLRERLSQDSTIPIDEALHILQEIADALAYAHEHGVVHRDIKPDNVLLSAGHALVTDFGVAKAVSESRVEGVADTITRPGTTLGTAAYMPPEQIAGEPNVDRHADLYSLGCLAYELLTGAPPFGRSPVHRVLTAHMNELPKAIPDIPDRLATLVMRCLEKNPAQRPSSAREVLDELRSLARQRRTRQVMVVRRRWWIAAAIGASIITVAAIGAYVAASRSVPLDPDLIAVFPFRVGGADPLTRTLREGMVDLVAAKLTGSARVADPRSLLVAWHRAGGSDTADLDERATDKIARNLAAGQILTGSVSGDGHSVIVTAALRDLRGGSTRRATVEGPQDSIPTLVDRLVGQLLALEAGEDIHSVASLGAMSLGSLREYIQAQSLSRRGRFEDAIPHYRAAIAADSNFALAGMGLGQTVGWLDAGDWNEGWRVAWRARDRLSESDRAVLEAWVGTSYPHWPSKARLRELAERAVQIAPQRAEAWYALGDNLYHFGALQGLDDAAQRALNALNRALVIDSTYGYAAEHLPDLYLRLGDSASARRAAEHLLVLDSTSRYGSFDLWFAGTVFANPRRRLGAMAAIRRMASTSLGSDIAQSALSSGIGYEDAEQLLGELVSGAATEDERSRARTWLFQLASARGHRAQAAQLFDGTMILRAPALFAGLYEGGDSATAARARRLASGALRADSVMQRCTEASLAAQYDLVTRGTSGTAVALQGLIASRLTRASADTADECAVAALTLRVQLAMNGDPLSLRVVTTRLDSALRTAPASPLLTIANGNIVTARAYEHLGEPARALQAVRRRPILYGPLLGWTSMLNDEARLAAASGDRAGAIRAYRLFIALRGTAELPLQPPVTAARRELARLEKEQRDAK